MSGIHCKLDMQLQFVGCQKRLVRRQPPLCPFALGALDVVEDFEALARQRKAEELPADLAGLYAEVRVMRRSKKVDRKRLTQILEDSKRFGDEPLLREEVNELLAAN